MPYFKPGMRDEGATDIDLLIAGEAVVRTRNVTFASGSQYLRGTLVALAAGAGEDPDAETYSAWAGGDIAEGSLLGIVLDDVDATEADAPGIIYVAADINANRVIVAEGGDLNAVRDRLHQQSIFLHDPVPAAS